MTYIQDATQNYSNNATNPIPSKSSLPTFTGFIFLTASSALYGSTYVPAKQSTTGDGMVFQFFLCFGIWIVGFVVNWIREFPQFYALPLLGGFFWATGNINTVPIMKTIGMGPGMLIWNVVNLVAGWAVARFGIFGLEQEVPTNQALNYAGVSIAALSAIFYIFVKSDPNTGRLGRKQVQPKEASNNEIQSIDNLESSKEELKKDADIGFIERQSTLTKRVIGVVLALTTGTLFSQFSTPILLAKQTYNKDGSYLDMLFSFYTGILVSSHGYFVIYSVAKKNNPVVFSRSLLPGLLSGVMWGTATVLYFMGTDVLNQATSYPISCAGPPIFSAIWSVLLYREVKGLKNLAFLLTGISLAVTGSVLIGVSF